MKSIFQSPAKIGVFLTLLLVGIVVATVILTNPNSTPVTLESNKGIPPIEGQPLLGEEDAPVTIVEFGDFKCPACKAWGETVFPKLVNDYIESGKVKFSYINVLFHGKESILASLAAESVFKQAPDSYWVYHKAIFDEQPPHQNHDDLWVTEEKLLEIASNISGIDMDQLKDRLLNETEMNEVEKDEKLVREFSVPFTPTIYVNGTMVEDPFDYEKIKELIERDLEESL